MKERGHRSGETDFTPEDHPLVEVFLTKKAPELTTRFREALHKLSDFKSALADDFLDNKFTNEVSFRRWEGLYTVQTAENKLIIIKKEVRDKRKGAFERTTITVGDLGNHILFERRGKGRKITLWPDTQQGYKNALTMLKGLMDQMDIMTQIATGRDFPDGMIFRPPYGFKSTNP